MARHLSMAYFVYVLRSLTTGRLYKGYCSNPVQRLGQHNTGVTKSTKNQGPWELVYQEELATRAQAVARERFLKSGQGRQWLKHLLEGKQDP